MVFEIHHKPRSLFLTLILVGVANEGQRVSLSQTTSKDWDMIAQLIYVNAGEYDTVKHITPRTGKRRGEYEVKAMTAEQFVDQAVSLAMMSGYTLSMSYDSPAITTESSFEDKVAYLLKRHSYRNPERNLNEVVSAIVNLGLGGE